MSKKANILSKLDQFGVELKPTIQTDQVLHKSTFGGVFSLLIYSVSLAYFVYVVQLWLQDQLLPKITIKNKILNYIEVNFEESPFTLNILSGVVPNVFQEQENYLTPFKIEVENMVPISMGQVFPTNSSTPGIVKLDNLELVINSGGITENAPKPQNQKTLMISRCDSHFLMPHQSCAKPGSIESYFENSKFLTINFVVQLKQFDTATGKVEKIPKVFVFPFDPKVVLYNQINIQTTKVTVYSGFLFQTATEYTFVSKVDLVTSTISQNYIRKSLGREQDVYSIFVINLDNNQEQQFIQYPSFGEIAAQVGSIVTILMALKAIVFAVNQSQLEKQIVDEVISFYYPEFKKLQLTQNMKGVITKVEDLQKKVYNHEPINQVYQNAYKIAKKKLNYTNIIYEISRLQFAVQHLCQREVLNQLKDDGIKLPLTEYSQKLKNNVQIVDISYDQQEEILPKKTSNFQQLTHIQEDDMSLFLLGCENVPSQVPITMSKN